MSQKTFPQDELDRYLSNYPFLSSLIESVSDRPLFSISERTFDNHIWNSRTSEFNEDSGYDYDSHFYAIPQGGIPVCLSGGKYGETISEALQRLDLRPDYLVMYYGVEKPGEIRDFELHIYKVPRVQAI